jgi:4-hydroxybenzoate polyprenyltransferase
LAYGYTINNFADRKQDKKAGKHPEIHHLSEIQLFFILGFLALGTVAIPMFFSLKVKILGLLNFFLATFYSMRPIRFKERGLLGIIVPAITQRPLLFLFFAFLTNSDLLITLYLALWLSFYGIIIMLAHQIFDLENDKLSGTMTWAVKVGLEKASKSTTAISLFSLFYTFIAIFLFQYPFGLVSTMILFVFISQPLMFYKYQIWYPLLRG